MKELRPLEQDAEACLGLKGVKQRLSSDLDDITNSINSIGYIPSGTLPAALSRKSDTGLFNEFPLSAKSS